MSALRVILASLTMLFGLGCASMPEPIEATAKPDPTKGIVLASLTSDGNSQVMDTWFFYRRKGTTEELRLDAFGVAGVLKKPNDFAGQGSAMGRLIALPLEPGEYELFNWMLYVSRLGGYGYISPRTAPAPHLFTIRAGTITYLGGLHIETVLGKNPLGISIPVGGIPSIGDRSSRDFPLMATKYPNLVPWGIELSIPDAAKWSVAQ